MSFLMIINRVELRYRDRVWNERKPYSQKSGLKMLTNEQISQVMTASVCHYTIIDFNFRRHKDLSTRKSVNSLRPLGRGEYYF